MTIDTLLILSSADAGCVTRTMKDMAGKTRDPILRMRVNDRILELLIAAFRPAFWRKVLRV